MEAEERVARGDEVADLRHDLDEDVGLSRERGEARRVEREDDARPAFATVREGAAAGRDAAPAPPPFPARSRG